MKRTADRLEVSASEPQVVERVGPRPRGHAWLRLSRIGEQPGDDRPLVLNGNSVCPADAELRWTDSSNPAALRLDRLARLRGCCRGSSGVTAAPALSACCAARAIPGALRDSASVRRALRSGAQPVNACAMPAVRSERATRFVDDPKVGSGTALLLARPVSALTPSSATKNGCVACDFPSHPRGLRPASAGRRERVFTAAPIRRGA